MTRAPRTLHVAGALLMVAGINGQQPREHRRPSGVGTASISGIVADETDARPLRRARVTLSGSELEITRTAITTDDGAFAFEGLPAGRYALRASKEGHVSMSLGAKRPGRPGTTLLVHDGEARKINLRLPWGSVITGTLLNPNGEPAPGITVRALASRYDPARGERRLGPAHDTNVVTDDRGVYRIFGLPAGTYVVAAVPRLPFQGIPGDIQVVSDAEVRRALAEVRQSVTSARPGIPTPAPRAPFVPEQRKTVSLAPVLYPGTSVQDRAMAITLGPGEVRHNVNFDLEFVPTSTIEGSIKVPPGMSVQLQIADADRAAANPTTRASASVGDDGLFAFRRIPPGAYTIAARAFSMASRSGATPAEGWLWAETNVLVSGDDISGVALMLQPALTISGRVGFDASEGPAPVIDLLRLQFPAASTSSNNSVVLPGVLINGSTFSLAGVLPGTYRFHSPPRGLRTPVGRWWLKSLMLGGKEMLDAELDLRQSHDDGVITFSDRASHLSGWVRHRDGTPVGDGYVVIFAPQRSAWFHGSRRVAGVSPSADGRYAVRNLPPGEYLVTACGDLEFNEWFDPEVLQALAPGALRITLGEYEIRTQDISVAR